MLDVRFRPIPKWERTPGLRYLNAPFKTPYVKTLDLLEREIRHLKGTDVRIEAGYQLSQIRNDGFPYSGASPSHPGVALYFETPNGSLCFPCGTYKRMEHNLHAIALTLECLRAVDRYGVTVGNEQYRGFLAIEAAAAKMSAYEAALWLASVSVVPKDHILDGREGYRAAYRAAAAKLHPDANAGDSREFLKLQEAKAVLDAHHGLEKTGSAR